MGKLKRDGAVDNDGCLVEEDPELMLICDVSSLSRLLCDLRPAILHLQCKYLSRKTDLDSSNDLKDCGKGQQDNLVPIRLIPSKENKE